MKEKEKKPIDKLSLILTAIGIVLAICEYFALVYSNFLLYNLGNFVGKLILTVLPILSIAVFIIGSILFFKKKSVIYIVAIGMTLVCSVGAFALSNTGSTSKISSDFLNNENLFNSVAEDFIAKSASGNSGSAFYEVENKELKNIINCKKAEVISIGKNKSVVFFYAFENSLRVEGYAYLPDEVYPIAWDANLTEWSDALDINEKWWYICIYK